jgi:hypothetical protein
MKRLPMNVYNKLEHLSVASVLYLRLVGQTKCLQQTTEEIFLVWENDH